MAAFRLLPPETTSEASRLLATRGIRAFGDGLVSLLLPVYLSLQGYDTIEIGGVEVVDDCVGIRGITVLGRVRVVAHTRDDDRDAGLL